MAPEKSEMSLSIEPLLRDECHGRGRPTRAEDRITRLPRALFTFLFAVMALSLGGALLVHFLPFLISLLHSLIVRFWQTEGEIGNYLQGEMATAERQFEQFERTFSRQWKSEKDRRERMGVFARNLREIERLNAEAKRQGRNVTFGVNDMADMTEEEMGQMLLPMDYFRKRRQNAKFIRKDVNPIMRRAFTARTSIEEKDDEGDEYPTHFDWREKGVVTPVKAQGMCGSCWAFAAVATTESAYAVAHGILRNLSEQELMDCNLENNACKGGNEDKAFRFIHEVGLVSGEQYPYVARRQNVCMLHEQNETLTKIDVAVFLNPDEQSMLDWLINFGPVNVGISVPPDMKPYKSGVYHPSDFDCQFRVLGGHSLLVVGYGQTVHGEKYWIVKNSWGSTWGQEHGYLNFVRGINACGIEDEPIGILA